MSRLIPPLLFSVALLIGVFIATLLDAPAASEPIAPSALSVVPSPKPRVDVSPATPSPPTNTPEEFVPPVVKKSVSTPATSTPLASVAAPVPPAVVSSGNIGLDASASLLRGALVNILCFVTVTSGLRSTSGSGIIIDSKGIILTNAHIAQYFLLADRADCTIRTGSPATDKYDAALIYISPAWLEANPTTLTQAAPSGTGEYDFALLAVTKSATSASLPPTFPSIALATAPSALGTPIVIASYGAQFLETSQVQSALFPTVVFGSVKDIFTFKTNTIDVLALGGSAAAQEGSSGGGVADATGELVGTITTSTVTGDTDTRSLSAITASYIRAEYASETGSALDLLLAKPTATAVSEFAVKLPALEAILTAHLP